MSNRILLIATLLFCCSNCFAQQKPNVAVFVTGDDPINEIVSNRFISNLKQSKEYTPVERSADFLAALSKEHSFERDGSVNDSEIARLGKQFGLQYVCVVSVSTVWQTEKYISVHIIDVNSAEVVGTCSTNGTVTTPDALTKALDGLSHKIKDAMEYNKKTVTNKVAVYVTQTGNKDVDIILADQLVAGFAKSGDYVAVERSNAFLKKLDSETKYQRSGMVDDNKRIAELGKRFGVQYVCVAKTIKMGGAYFITARLINVETAEICKMVNYENETLEKSSDVVDVAQLIADDMSIGAPDEDVFRVVEVEPEFPGGIDAMYKFIVENITYPSLAKECGITGTVYVNFVVEKNGSVSDVHVVGAKRSIINEDRSVSFEVCEALGGGCDAEAIRVVQLMPRWKPGRQHEKRVRVLYTLPINFILN